MSNPIKTNTTDILSYGFIKTDNIKKPARCIVCNTCFSSELLKPSKAKRHLDKIHSDIKDNPIEYFINLKEKLLQSPSIIECLDKESKKEYDGQILSLEFARLIGINGFSHTIGEKLIREVITFYRNMCVQSNSLIPLKYIYLSNNSIKRRLIALSDNIEHKLISILQNNVFSIQLDETTTTDNKAYLMVCARFFYNGVLCEEFLFINTYKSETTGRATFDILYNYFNINNISFNNIVGCVTDGAPSMTGKQNGFVSHFKKVAPHTIFIHCIVHRQNLVAKDAVPVIEDSLNIVIKIINIIKSHSKRDRIFNLFCHEMDSDYKNLLYHTEVRWLSKGQCLNRFVDMFDTICDFSKEFLYNELINGCKLYDLLYYYKVEIYYMADMFTHINNLILKLQGRDKILFDCVADINTFIDNLKIYRNNIEKEEYRDFINLFNIKDNISVNNKKSIICHIDAIKISMEKRFSDILNTEKHLWFKDPFAVNICDQKYIYQQELVKLKNNDILLYIFKTQGIRQMWLHSSVPDEFPCLWKEVQLQLLVIPTTYLTEGSFSILNKIKSKERNRLDLKENGDLRVNLTKNIKPDTETIAKSFQKHKE